MRWSRGVLILAVASVVSLAMDRNVVAEPFRIQDVPHIEQKPDFCGEACVAMALQGLGVQVDQDAVFDHSGLDPVEGRGCYTRELVRAVKSLGFDPGPVWYAVDPKQADADLERAVNWLVGSLSHGQMSIVCMHYDGEPKSPEHFRLLLAYDAGTDEFLYHEPALPNGKGLRMSRARLKELWPLKYEADRWSLVSLSLKPVQLPAAEASERFTAADYAQHIHGLKKTLPPGFHLRIEEPFVVAGDEDPKTVDRRSQETVRWAVDRLRRDYFQRDPLEIVTVWLFRDNVSYETHVEKLFGKKPTTPYGYYSPAHRALVMNISTGGGTLVHELVHPFIHSNFWRCPAWFNEGLASLYEQSGDREGHIVGLTNWRLKGLQRTIGDGKLLSFNTLCHTKTNEFYGDSQGTNYAQARYLCYYLQEQGKLVQFYHQFVKNAATDPSGYATLKSVLGTEDMTQFQKDWEAYVRKLSFPD